MSKDSLILENMDLSDIHLSALKIKTENIVDPI